MRKCIRAVLQKRRGRKLPDKTVIESRTNAINKADPAEKNEDDHFETVNLSQNKYLSCIYHKLLGFNPDEGRES